MKKVCLIALVIFLGGFLLPTPTNAVGVMPAKYDNIVADPGEVLQFEFAVLAEPPPRPDKTFYFSTQNFIAGPGETGAQNFIEDNIEMPKNADLASWITVIEESVTLAAGEETKVHFVVNVPQDAEPGGHYAVIWTGENPPGEEGGIVGVGGNVGVLLLVRVTGEVKEVATVKEFNFLKKFQTRLPVDFYTRIANEGSVHEKPTGDIIIKNLFGLESAKVDANTSGANVLPNSIRRMESVWVNNPGLQDEGFFSAAKNEWKNFAFGPYKANLNMMYGAENLSLTAMSGYFWVFPWHLLLLCLILLIVLIIIIKGYNKLVVRMAQKQKK
jgi:hypothetical protein